MTKYEEELEAWKDFELDCLIEEQEKPPQIIDFEDGSEYVDMGEFGNCYDD